MVQEEEIRRLVRRTLERISNPDASTSGIVQQRAPISTRAERLLITEADLIAVPAGGTFPVPPDAIITPLAREAARTRNISFVEQSVTPSPRTITTTKPTGQHSPGESGPTEKTVAIGADHGGFEMKEDLKRYITELGYVVQDCGTFSTESVDYPDFAYAVAKSVADGKARWGIVIDGAGIGSCMVANKVPGVRAAMCYDLSTAVNSREHNDANVLTLGGKLIGQNLARDIVKTWLNTPFGGGRHARRVDKIMEVEKRFLRKGQ